MNKENTKKHLNHPFYEDANSYRESVRLDQILKGAEKYPEPFNPKSWTSKQLVEHAMQENVDQAHYIYGLFTRIVELEQALDFYAQLENYDDKHRSPFNSEHYYSDVTLDRGEKAREALGYSEED